MLTTTALLLAVRLAAQEPDRLLAAVPADAAMVLTLAGFDEIRHRAAGNAWWQLARGEELRPFFARGGELLARALDEALEGEDERLRELADPMPWLRSIHGPVAAFAALDGDRLGGIGVFVEPGADPVAFDELWGLARDEVRKERAESNQEYQGVELTLLESSDDEHNLGIFFDVAGTRALVMGEERDFTLELAQGAIDRLLGKDPSPGFAAHPALAEARRALPDRRAFELFADVAAFARFGLAEDARERAADPESAESAEEVARQLRILERVGISTMRYAHVAADLGEAERFDLVFSVHLPPGSVLQELAAHLRPPARDLFGLAPADSISASTFALDLAGLWETIQDVVADFEPSAQEQMEVGLAQFEAVLGLDLEEDFLEQVSGDVLVAEVPIPEDEVPTAVVRELGPEGKALARTVGVVALRVEDGERIESFLARLLELFGMAEAIEEEEYQGHAVQHFGADEVDLYWSCTDEFFVYSQTPTPLRAVLARIGDSELPSLTGDARYRPHLEANARAAVLGVGDARVILETVLRGARFGFEVSLAEPSGGVGPEVQELLALFPEPSFVGNHIDGVIVNFLEVGPESLVLRMGAR